MADLALKLGPPTLTQIGSVMTSSLWVGLDVGEDATAVCVIDRSGEPVLERSSGSSALEIAHCLSEFRLADISVVAMETGVPVTLPHRLAEFGFPVSVLDAGKASKVLSIRRHKTDVNDARGLAEIARLGGGPRLAIYLRGGEAQQIRNEIALRHRMVWLLTACRACLRSMLRNYGSGIKQLGVGLAMRDRVEAEMRALVQSGVPDAARTLTPLLDICVQLHLSIRKIDKDFKVKAERNPVTRRFIKIPGVGPICALSFYSTIDEPSRFRRPADVGPYLGMVPTLKQSGTSLRRSGITRAGDRLTRSHLVISAGVMMSRAAQRCALSDWGAELAKRSGYGRARTAVGRKLATVMLRMWQSDSEFEPYPIPL